jgi:hypothetical protein
MVEPEAFDYDIDVTNPLEQHPIKVRQGGDVLWLGPLQARELAEKLQSYADKVQAARVAWSNA